MKIRRYFGFDCDSTSGFNNGCYIDQSPIEVVSEDHAMELCLEFLGSDFDLREVSPEESDNGYTLITGYYDDEGNTLTESEFLELNENTDSGAWRYVFVNFEVCD